MPAYPKWVSRHFHLRRYMMNGIRKKLAFTALGIGAFLLLTGGEGMAAEVTTTAPSASTFVNTLEKMASESKQAKTHHLNFKANKYSTQEMTYQGQKVKFRAYENIVYVAHPAAQSSESMSIYIPEAYFTKGGTVNGYTAKTAPIFMPNGVGGYMPGTICAPSENDKMSGGANASLGALAHGYVVAAPAIRGRTTKNSAGVYVGKAPALIVDYKAAVRYLRHNRNKLPAGDTEKIISNGTSAGGALSALLGATGNAVEYEPYLRAIGAANERDDIFASMDYCPITNLDHADMAYEWVFNGQNDYHQSRMMVPPAGMKPGALPTGAPAAGAKTDRPANAPTDTVEATPMTAEEIAVSAELKKAFPAYLNSLGLKDKEGTPLRLNADGTGTFADYIKSVYMASAQSALDRGEDLSALGWLTMTNGKVTDMDLGKYAAWATRMKAAPAFDKLDGSSPENDEFGDSANNPKHFTRFSKDHGTKNIPLADSDIITLMNPMNFIGQKGVTTAHYWRIRHGAKDRDTSLAIPAILALDLANHGADVDFASLWGKSHAGDYDLDDLFAWIDRICKK